MITMTDDALPEVRLDNLIENLAAQAKLINERYIKQVEVVSRASDHYSLEEAMNHLQAIARHSHYVGQLLGYHQDQRKIRESAKQKEAQLS